MKEQQKKIPKIGNVISKTVHLETLLDFVRNIVILDALEGFVLIKMGASWCKISHSELKHQYFGTHQDTFKPFLN